MDENEALVGELRRYLSSAQRIPNSQETEQVKALKRDLNLASRVGQQLLMQLRTAECQRDAGLQEIEKLRQKNTEIARENQRLAAEHGALSDSLAEQEAQIGSLIAQLATAQQRANRLARATAAAKALEREVHLLEQIQADLRAELEHTRNTATQYANVANDSTENANYENMNKMNPLDTSIRDTDIPGALAARRLAKSIEHELAELKLEHKHDPTTSLASLPSLTMGTDGSTYELDIHPTEMGTPKHQRSEMPHYKISPAPNSTSSPAPKAHPKTPVRPPVTASQFSPITPAHSGSGSSSGTGSDYGFRADPITDSGLRPDAGGRSGIGASSGTGSETSSHSGMISDMPGIGLGSATGIPVMRPKLRHAHSHESVLSLVPSPPRMAHMAPRMAAPAPDAPRVLGTISEPAMTQRVSSAVPSQLPVRSAARDKLSQVRGGVEIRRPERRWAFTPFRM